VFRRYYGRRTTVTQSKRRSITATHEGRMRVDTPLTEEVRMPEKSSSSTATPDDTRTPQCASPVSPQPPMPLVEQDLLVEDVSIDGMCGVY
jgi:mycofactocin precursor